MWQLAEEAPVAFLLNGDSFAVMLASPADLEDLAIGFALTEGLVAAAEEIESLRIAEAQQGYVVNLKLPEARVRAAEGRRRSLAGRAGCGLCGAQTIAAALPPPRRVAGPWPEPAAVARAFAALPGAQPLNASTRSVHGAAFCDRSGRILALREDVGRHNALDKLGGAMLRAGLDAGQGFAVLTSRIGVELVQKAAALGLPFVAALSAPSALALRMAGACGMGLASRAGDGVMMFDPPGCGEDAA
ncbi:MAG: formate dehydrogenase accessory sulfurtransferase FdhD [Alphaproteobacteria bacterium]|nr:MAG: formate dehydrogenase accessory sulfurtransferase FdhD [Alphaproteobacteria bacterium]